MLLVAVLVFMPAGIANVVSAGTAKENVIETLLSLPAPPPPNPLETGVDRDESFYDPEKPPADDAPIEDLVDYWTSQSGQYRGALYYLPRPSQKIIERLLAEGGRSIPDLLSVLPDDKRTIDVVSSLYNDRSTSEEERTRLREWLLYNSPVFSDQLAARSENVRDSNDYVNAMNENSLLALTRHDWDAARPIVDRLYNDSTQPVSKALATWALYRHAMESGDSADTERYRSELMRMVENKSLSDGVRDMANDAIVREPDFPGRDEWCWSLFEDETLVNMQRFTGLTTLIMYQPPDKYVPKMIEFLKSSNKTVRQMAARNLITAMDRSKNPEIIRALLPWLEDPKWIDLSDTASARTQMVMFLSNTKMPESVPGLIAALNEKATRESYGPNANVIANAAIVSSNSNTNRSYNANFAYTNSNTVKSSETYFPLREYAVRALAMQADPRAIPALRRILVSATDYQRNEVIHALFTSGGFSVPEQVNALEAFARSAATDEELTNTLGTYVNSANTSTFYYAQMAAATYAASLANSTERRNNTDFVLGSMVATSPDPSEVLARATIDRIEELAKSDPQTSQALRRIIIGWKGLAVSSLLLRDLKNGNVGSDAIIRLLAERKLLREKLIMDVSDARSGTPVAAGIASCILEDPADHDAIINSKNIEARTALYACARLVRASLPLAKVADDLGSADKDLKTAAELYLESEDSAEARNIVLTHQPNEAKILGATSCFPGKDDKREITPLLTALFASASGRQAGSYYSYGGCAAPESFDSEAALQKEAKQDQNLLGIYAYQENFVRIYKDKVVFSWQDDPARYRERILKPGEFEALKQLFLAANVGELKPFLSCRRGCSDPRELLMLGRQGGRRVFVRSDRQPHFFIELEKLLAEFRSEPAELKYALSQQVPGLEVLFASDDLDAQIVWKQGSDLRVVVSNKAVRQKVESELSALQESIYSDDEETDVEPDTADEPPPVRLDRMRERRQYEGIGWFAVTGGKLGPQISQPVGFDYIPKLDGLQVQPAQETWKARAAGFEIRTNDSGVYKAADGKLIQLLKGYYSSPIISSNGRWLAVAKFDENEGPSLVRYDIVSKREYKVPFEGYGMLSPRCFVPALGRFLLVAGYGDEEGGYSDVEEVQSQQDDPRAQRYYLLDPQTGVLTPAFGELRPLAEQSFRPLQPTGNTNEFWAALSNGSGDQTTVGLYDARSFRFSPVLRLPKISFGSMDMWVDKSDGKVYFVYNGHLLSVPLKPQALPKS